MSEKFASLKDWISFESVSTTGSNYSLGDQYLLAITGIGSGFEEPEAIRFCQCTLKKDLMQFPAGTFFDEIAINEHDVMYFYRYDASQQHLFQRAGYEYLGHCKWQLVFDDSAANAANADEDEDGERKRVYDFFLRESTEVTEQGFNFEDCKAKRQLGKIKKGESFPNAVFDLVNGAFTLTTTKKGAIGGRLLVCFGLTAREISQKFLEQALAERMITQSDYDERKRSGEEPDMFSLPHGKSQGEKRSKRLKRK
jgi:hypothetical protein